MIRVRFTESAERKIDLAWIWYEGQSVGLGRRLLEDNGCQKSQKRSVTADTDLRLCKYFGLSEGFFLRLQNEYDLMLNRLRLRTELTRIHPRAA